MLLRWLFLKNKLESWYFGNFALNFSKKLAFFGLNFHTFNLRDCHSLTLLFDLSYARSDIPTFHLGQLELTPAMMYCILPVEHWAAEHRVSASIKWCPSLIWTFPPAAQFSIFIYIHINKVTSSLHLSTGFNIFIGLADAVLLGAADLIHHHIFINFTMHDQS